MAHGVCYDVGVRPASSFSNIDADSIDFATLLFSQGKMQSSWHLDHIHTTSAFSTIFALILLWCHLNVIWVERFTFSLSKGGQKSRQSKQQQQCPRPNFLSLVALFSFRHNLLYFLSKTRKRWWRFCLSSSQPSSQISACSRNLPSPSMFCLADNKE